MEAKDLQTSDTKNWQAFHLATEALRDIDKFTKASVKDPKILVEARKKLQDAVRHDRTFLRARYYGAVVDDMLGYSKDAVEELSTLIQDNPTFKEEAEYNLGVSYYHVYSRPEMEAAIATFQRVKNETRDEILKHMAGAGLVRSYSMMVLHELRAGKEQEAGEFFAAAVKGSAALLDQVASDTRLDENTRNEILWRVRNGRGVGFMFHSDKEQNLKNRNEELHKALADFENANRSSPHNWEVVCNLGSVHMRLGYVARLAKEPAPTRQFNLAKKYLNDVLENIRPEYGFALYEMGRVFRLEGDFPEALRWFAEAMRIPEKIRNIGDKGLKAEIDKANRQDMTL